MPALFPRDVCHRSRYTRPKPQLRCPMRPLPILLAALLLTSPAHAFIAQNGLAVEGQGGGFTVPWRGPSGAVDFWCAAGDYVIRGQNQPPATPIYRVSVPPRRAGEGMEFSLSPDRAAPSTGVFTLFAGHAGAMSAASAQSYCEVTHKRQK